MLRHHSSFFAVKCMLRRCPLSFPAAAVLKFTYGKISRFEGRSQLRPKSYVPAVSGGAAVKCGGLSGRISDGSAPPPALPADTAAKGRHMHSCRFQPDGAPTGYPNIRKAYSAYDWAAPENISAPSAQYKHTPPYPSSRFRMPVSILTIRPYQKQHYVPQVRRC